MRSRSARPSRRPWSATPAARRPARAGPPADRGLRRSGRRRARVPAPARRDGSRRRRRKHRCPTGRPRRLRLPVRRPSRLPRPCRPGAAARTGASASTAARPTFNVGLRTVDGGQHPAEPDHRGLRARHRAGASRAGAHACRAARRCSCRGNRVGEAAHAAGGAARVVAEDVGCFVAGLDGGVVHPEGGCRGAASADASAWHRNLRLRTLDRFGLGFGFGFDR